MTKSEPPKKLTPMEKLKLKMRQGLEKQSQYSYLSSSYGDILQMPL